MNQITGNWCRFTGWDAHCFELLNDELYYGGTNAVVKCDTGADDNGASISLDVLPAFDYYKQHNQKRFTMCRPIFKCSIQPTAALALYTDFKTADDGTVAPLFQDNTGAVWNVSLWNTSLWTGSPTQVYADWYSLAGIGFAASIRLKLQAKGVTLSWSATDLVFETGGTL